MNKLAKKIALILLVLAAISAIAYPKIQHLFSNSANQDQSNESQQNLQVEVYVPGYSSIEDKIFATGSILANEDVDLSAEASGIITDIHFTEGRKRR